MRRLLIMLLLITVFTGCVLLSGGSARASFLTPLESSRAKDFTLLKKDGVWYLIGINAPVDAVPPGQPETPGLPVFTSYDLEHWSPSGSDWGSQNIAIPVGAPGAWDDYAIWAPTIVKSGDTYYLYYTGVQKSGVNYTTYVQKIGLAISTDLIHWTKSGSNPVFDCSQLSWAHWDLSDTQAGSWYGADCRDPFVTRDEANNRWVMFFTARLPHVADAPYSSIPFPSVIGMATSTDLTNWSDAGYLPITRGYTSESPHTIEHNGTWYLIFTGNCSFQNTTKCLNYSTAATLSGTYSGYNDLPDVSGGAFASEYYRDVDGTEYFGYSDNGTLRFGNVDWGGGGFGYSAIPAANFRGVVWNDVNRNGVQDADESGINNVTIRAYLDDGDGQFDAARDHLLIYSITKRRSINTIWMEGVYAFAYMQPGKTWLVVAPENFNIGGALYGLTGTAGSAKLFYDVTQTETVTNATFGFAPPDLTPPGRVEDLAAE